MDWDADDLDDAAGMERHRKLSRAEQVRLLLDQYQKNRDSRERPSTEDIARDDHAERLEANREAQERHQQQEQRDEQRREQARDHRGRDRDIGVTTRFAQNCTLSEICRVGR